ncbi:MULTISPECIES: fumarylacetoacetate hydrolase family protein [Niastella]|uniref:Fumarylacetoacetate hydrolase family protein n=1 Tax=Niastella soli TaxID=2821487 RepID=A0ABS3YSI0_9BACT|nr:fumarylacetoacetate hydrolase family protein [Niastella soli]MBO9200854.1 fumarylacetoacetate hydrolase family protein [Niastella soli]
MKLYKTGKGILLQFKEEYYVLQHDWDKLINRDNLYSFLLEEYLNGRKITNEEAAECHRVLLPPIGSQEVWAAGVTYLRSRDARMEESKDTGGADCYSRVYEAERPELFFKALPHRVVGHEQKVYIRKDSTWNVPEPELALYINSAGVIQGYTIGNDMSSRSIEGENPLYLPQAKVYEKSAGLGPCLYVPAQPIAPETGIYMTIHRNGEKMYEGSTTISRMKRMLPELVDYLYKECDFATGCFLMTGTCLVPPTDFTLQPNDRVTISIDGIGTMVNLVDVKGN